MTAGKVMSRPVKGKRVLLDDFDHFIAVDWSQTTMAIAHMRRRDKEPIVFERAAELASLKEYLRTLRGRTVLTLEETTSAHWLYLELRDSVTHIIICNPYTNRLLSSGPKTDKIDAAKLCLLLRAGLLQEVFHRDDGLYDLRLLVSAYIDLVKASVRSSNQHSALVRGHCEASAHARFILDELNATIKHFRHSRREYTIRFEEFCAHSLQARRIMKVEGIGTIGAVKLLATVVDARRFPKTGKYLSYCGLVTHEKSSGGRSYGRRKGQYCRLLKAVYKTAALAAIKGTNPISEYYRELLTRGMTEHHARHQIARYIATVTYGILKTGTPYDPYRWRKLSQVA